MGDYLVILANDGTKSYRNGPTFDQYETSTLLAFNLLDNTVQEGEIEVGSLRSSSFLKYGDNQIIKYSNDDHDFSLVCITVESFERILFI